MPAAISLAMDILLRHGNGLSCGIGQLMKKLEECASLGLKLQIGHLQGSLLFYAVFLHQHILLESTCSGNMV